MFIEIVEWVYEMHIGSQLSVQSFIPIVGLLA